MVLDPVGDRLIIAAGLGGEELNDAWELPLSGSSPYPWHRLSPVGSIPDPRTIDGAQYDPVRDRMIFHGGSTAAGATGETLALELGASPAWSTLTTSGNGPGAVRDHVSVYDPDADRLLVFGGRAPSVFRNSVHALSLADGKWSQLAPGGTPPSARGNLDALYDPLADPISGRMVIHGGWNGVNLTETWALQWDSPSVDVPEAPAANRLQLLGARPNPSSGDRLTVAFTLAARSNGRIDLLDIAGRRIATRDLAAFEPGRHQVTFGGERPLEPGLYLIRLASQNRVLTSKAMVVR
jgi:hypothetical protein